MLATLSATEVAFVMAGLMQGTLGIVWLVGGWAVGDARRASVQWAAYAALSALSFMLLVAGLRAAEPAQAEALRAIGNLCGLAGLIALQRGIWLFTGAALERRDHLFVLGVALVASWIGLDPAAGYIRVSVFSCLLAWLCAGMARDLYRYGQGALRLRWPLLFGGAGFALRGLRALAQPASVAAEMTTHSALNVGS